MADIDMSKVADTNAGKPATRKRELPVGAVATWADERLGLAKANTNNSKQSRPTLLLPLRKVFPDHWSFMLGEIALWSFVVLLVTGTFLTLWFDPSMAETHYQGSYDPMRGVEMSRAFASTLELSFDVRGGLLIRQMHHWAAHFFIAAMLVHMLRVAVTGAYRKPRELNWVIGTLLLLLGTIEGFTGYSLPDDLLSGTGIRAADGFMKASPVIGSYMSFFLFGGEFPGESIIPRLYVIHILLIPGILLALVMVHIMLLVYHKHTQWPGPGKTNENVVGPPFMPIYMAKAGGFLLIVFGVIAALGGLVTMNPVWKYGPYDPTKITAGVQPDWYMGWPDGLLRIIPTGWETNLFNEFTISWNVMLPILLAPPMALMVLMAMPFVEQWVTGDKREHHLLQRPRNAPTRTAFMVALMTFYGIAWAAGGNDIIAIKLHMSINQITYIFRVLIFVGPVIAFIIAKRWCISLQRHDEQKLLHGYETGVIMRSPEGGYSEKHLPISDARAYTLTARDREETLGKAYKNDAYGVRQRGYPLRWLRTKLSQAMFADNVQKPTAEELEAAKHHAEHEHELQAALDGQSADGHQFDGMHEVEKESLRDH